MRILARVKPNSKTESVERLTNSELTVRVKAPAKEGKANEAVIGLLSDFFGVPKSRIVIVKGKNSKTKLVEIYGRY